jgi:hypothetical protein
MKWMMERVKADQENITRDKKIKWTFVIAVVAFKIA